MVKKIYKAKENLWTNNAKTLHIPSWVAQQNTILTAQYKPQRF